MKGSEAIELEKQQEIQQSSPVRYSKGQSGNPKGGKIGNKGGTGRPPNVLRELCVDLIDRFKLAERLAEIGAGHDVAKAIGPFGPLMNKKGNQIYVPAPISAQIDAITELMEWGHVKPAKEGEIATLEEINRLMRQRYGFE